MMCRWVLQAEGAALDEDEQAEGDQNQGQQDVAPAGKCRGDDGSGGEELAPMLRPPRGPSPPRRRPSGSRCGPEPAALGA